MQKYKEKYTNPEICSGGTRFCGTAEASTRSGVAERQSDFSKYKNKSMSRKKGNTQTAKYQDCRTAEV